MTAEQEKSAHSYENQTNSEVRQQSQSARSPAGPTISTDDRIALVRDLNDRLRKEGRGGIIQMTNGVASLGLARVNAIFREITEFSAFTSDNDPWGEHDCAVMTILGHRIIWKIDYYDRSRSYHSPDPADPKLTVRVMTVMLASEY